MWRVVNWLDNDGLDAFAKKVCFNSFLSGQVTELVEKKIQAVFVIRGFAISGFDYSRTRKQGKTGNNEGKTEF